jgi:DNA-directed RNA polymerase subunit N (RpoN/RPB10)
MIIPVRCFTCGKVLADKWTKYSEELRERQPEGRPPERIYMDGSGIPKTIEYSLLEKYGIKRVCCRRIFLTHVDLITKI